jgi:hypothetical protein
MFITRAILLVVDFNINLHSIAYIAEKEIQNTSQGHLDKLEKIASTRESLSRFDSFKDAFECEQSSINFVLFGKWYIEKREFFKGFIVLKIMLFFFILFMIPVVGLILGYPRTWNIEFGDIDCNSVQIFSTYVELSILLLCSFLAFAIYRRLKRVQENTGIKNELKWNSISIFLLTMFIIITTFLSDHLMAILKSNFNMLIWKIATITLPVINIIFQSFFRIIYRIRRYSQNQNEIQEDEETAADNFLKLLNSRTGLLLFQEHMSKQFKVEILLFWRDIGRFREGKVDSRTVYETYLLDNSPLKVSIHKNTLGKISNYISHKYDQDLEFKSQESIGLLDNDIENEENLFDEAYLEIFQKMLAEEFKIYRKTESYQNWFTLRSRNT